MEPAFRIPRAPTNCDGWVPDPDSWNLHASASEWLSKFGVGSGLTMSSGPAGRVISAIPNDRFCLVEITGPPVDTTDSDFNYLYYTGTAYFAPGGAAMPNTGATVIPGLDGNGVPCVILNLPEVASLQEPLSKYLLSPNGSSDPTASPLPYRNLFMGCQIGITKATMEDSTTSKPIIAIQAWHLLPATVNLTAYFTSGYNPKTASNPAVIYKARIVEGATVFVGSSGTGFYPSFVAGDAAGTDQDPNCIFVNVWETGGGNISGQGFTTLIDIPGPNTHWGLFPGVIVGVTNVSGKWLYVVYGNIPVASAYIGTTLNPNPSLGGSPGATYGAGEQTILSDLQAAVRAQATVLSTLILALQDAGLNNTASY